MKATALRQELEECLGEPFSAESIDRIAYGGRLRTLSGKNYFLKKGVASRMYRCEANGLRELALSGTISVVNAVAVGENFVLTRYVERGSMKADFFEDFGRSLARMHRYTASSFGFYEDNFIGANPQLNCAEGCERTDWTAFYFQKRLLFQFRLAERNGYVTSGIRSDFSALEHRLPELLRGSEEPPCLLHGDLWNGNFLCGSSGKVVLIDPAVYYGHREAELAMTRLFGGFPDSFYQAYRQEYPLPEGWEYRENLYRLYHLLNHLNLFGKSYLPEVEVILRGYRGRG